MDQAEWLQGPSFFVRKNPKWASGKKSKHMNAVIQPPLPPLQLDDIESADLLVGDSSDVNDWNTFMNLPTLGTPFTSVSVIGDEVFLYGGSNIKVKPGLMFDSYASTFFLLSVIDEAGCITSVGGDAFSYCAVLTTVDLPACTIVYGSADSPFLDYGGFGGCLTLSNLNIPLLEIIGDRAFRDCTSLLNVDFPLVTSVGLVAFLSCPSINSVNLPLCTNIGNQCFQNSYLLTLINLPSCVNLGTTTELNYVFNGVIGNTITATFNNVLQTNNSGNPDGDIQELVANNTVTITYV